MKEIDFLPEWYKNSRRRQISYRTQYIVLGCMFVTIMMWNFIAARSISRAAAEFTKMTPTQVEAERTLRDSAGIRSQIAQLQKKADVLKNIDSKIDAAGVLAEISFLVNGRIMLSKVEFKAERFVDKKNMKTGGDVLFTAGGGKEKPLGDVRFKVVISGIALDASDVAEFTCRLEDSPYFCQAVPSFSRNIKIKAEAGPEAKNHQVSEFEISCYLSNYQVN